MDRRHDGIEPAEAGRDTSPEAGILSGTPQVASERPEKAGKGAKRKAAKLRAVWISFTGRIVAQFVGSAASILLGITMIQSYAPGGQATAQTAVARDSGPGQGRVARVSDAGTHRRPSIVVLPFDDFSAADTAGPFAAALTELVTASLAERESVVVLSRTSATQVGTRSGTVPAIALELGVDLVLESSVTRSGGRVRVVTQLIDGRSDQHLWIGRYDREMGDILGLQAEIAGQIAGGIEAALAGASARVARN